MEEELEPPMLVVNCPDAECRMANRCIQGAFQVAERVGNTCDIYDDSQGLDRKQIEIFALYEPKS